MDLHFDLSFADGYKSKSQIARVLTENWLATNMYCPICGETSIRHAEPNAPVKDFVCDHCKSQYELKSKQSDSSRFIYTVVDGVYQTMISRITSLENPSFFFLHYDRYEVNNLVIVPKCFFVPQIIVKRSPLPSTAERAGWVGCNIQLSEIPDAAKIPIIIDGTIRNPQEVVSDYNKIYSLQTNSLEGRRWLVDILSCVQRLGRNFTLQNIYAFADELKLKHPDNNHIHDKIRQQLQFLRNKGLLEFTGRGTYRRIL